MPTLLHFVHWYVLIVRHKADTKPIQWGHTQTAQGLDTGPCNPLNTFTYKHHYCEVLPQYREALPYFQYVGFILYLCKQIKACIFTTLTLKHSHVPIQLLYRRWNTPPIFFYYCRPLFSTGNWRYQRSHSTRQYTGEMLCPSFQSLYQLHGLLAARKCRCDLC